MPYPQTLDLAKKVYSDENSSYTSKTFKTLTSVLFASAAAAAYVIFFLFFFFFEKNGNERRIWEKLQKPSFYLTNQV